MVRRQELDRGLTLVGPHRDDLVLTLNGLPAKGYASHGESWSFALALKLAAAATLRADSPLGDPVVILDDGVIGYVPMAVLILLIAVVNYINLATARSTDRAREVGPPPKPPPPPPRARPGARSGSQRTFRRDPKRGTPPHRNA